MFWQEKSFGAFSVNERTAVTDNNNHEVLLGSGGLLSRYDIYLQHSDLKIMHLHMLLQRNLFIGQMYLIQYSVSIMEVVIIAKYLLQRI